MAYVHIAHDCHVGNDTIFGNQATLGGHVTVEDFANVSAGSGVHQFCRVGRYAFIGGYSVVTKDALPYARTVGNRARIYGLNTIGLMRRGFTSESVMRLKRTFRYLLQSKLNTTNALQQIEADATLAKIPARRIGTTGGSAMSIGRDSVDLGALRALHENWFPTYMAAPA